MQTDKAVKKVVREFVVRNYLFGQESGVEGDTSFLQAGIVDSTGVLELVAFLEETFGIRVNDSDMSTDNLDSIDKVTRFVEAKLAAAA